MGVEVTVRCYGPARHEARTETLVVVVDAPASVESVLRAIADDPGSATGLVQLLPHCAVAIDDALVARDHPVADGVELALLPPVAGG